MLRVAYLFERFPSFGQTFCYREVAELVRQGAEVTVFSIRRPSGELPEDWDEEIVRRVVHLPEEAELIAETKRLTRMGRVPAAAVAVLKEWGREPDFLRLHQAAYIGARLREAGIERVHAHFAGMAARTAYWVRRFFAVNFSVTAHANDIFAPREFAIGLERLFAEATAVVTVSDFAVAELQKRFPREAAKFHRVYNGVDAGRFQAAEFAGSVPVILGVGRLIAKKGFADLICACAILQERGVPFRCEIVGEGPLAEALRGQIAEARLEDSARLLGPQTQREITAHLAAATVFVLPCCADANGDMDNLPTVIMEAMAAGLPVISTTIAGVPEMVEPGKTGELVPPNSPERLAEAIASLLADPARCREFGARARETAVANFSLAKNVSALAEILARDESSRARAADNSL